MSAHGLSVGQWVQLPPEAVGLPPAEPGAPVVTYRVKAVSPNSITFAIESDPRGQTGWIEALKSRGAGIVLGVAWTVLWIAIASHFGRWLLPVGVAAGACVAAIILMVLNAVVDALVAYSSPPATEEGSSERQPTRS